MDKELSTQIDTYIATLLTLQDDVLEAVLHSAAETGLPHISVSPNEGKLLQLLAMLCNARRILEIGTLAGYSAIWMARALPADGRLVTIEADPQHASVAQQNIARAGLTEQIDLRVGQALDILPRLKEEQNAGAGPFDMIFIDADKAGYVDYFHWSLRLARPGTLIVADNVIRDGKVLDPASTDTNVVGIQRFNTALSTSTLVTATIIQTVGAKGHDGMALAVVKR